MLENNQDASSEILIVAYPDSRLTTAASDVVDFNDEDYLSVVDKLIRKMAQADHCVGLAANQIGSNLNVFVANAAKNKRETSEYGFVVVVNPKIVNPRGTIQRREGCMSVPDLTVDVTRYENLTVTGFDKTGNPVNFEISGFEARVFQHEIDHLKGRVILDCAKSSRDIYSRKNYRK